MLWNLFCADDSNRCYYEPCHPNLLSHIRYTKPESSHQGIGDYWHAYRDCLDELSKVHLSEFAFRQFYLEPDDEYPALEKYLRFLLEWDPTRTPVLQFNRCNFRMGWLKRKFPEARIMTLERNSRDVWFSMVRHHAPEERNRPMTCDPYELMLESLGLMNEFPFLVTNDVQSSYQRHFYLWRMSQLLSRAYSEAELNFDRDFMVDPMRGVDRIIDQVPELRSYRTEMCRRVSSASSGRWRQHASEDWFADIEDLCETKLQSLGLSSGLGRVSLRQIVAENRSVWQEYAKMKNSESVHQFLNMYSTLASSSIEIQGRLSELERPRMTTFDGTQVVRRFKQRRAA